MGLVKGTAKIGAALLILWAVVLIIDGKFDVLAEMGMGILTFSQQLPPQTQQILGVFVVFGAFIGLMKMT